MFRTLSVAAFAAMVVGLVGLMLTGRLLARHTGLIAVQIAAVLLMVAARVAFGRRSFHAAANPTAGGIVTSGPYAYVRHPIYAAVLYFVWAGALDHWSWATAGYALMVTAGAALRMMCEERLLVETYPEYRSYKRRVARVVPFVY